MKIQTKLPVTIAQAKTFEDEQGAKGIKKLNILSQEDCIWQLQVGKPTMKEGFEAEVKWYQNQPYDLGDGELGVMPVLMFSEQFKLTAQEMDDLFIAVGIAITPPDSLAQKFDEIVLAGIFHWIGNIRQIFGLGPEGFETIA